MGEWEHLIPEQNTGHGAQAIDRYANRHQACLHAEASHSSLIVGNQDTGTRGTQQVRHHHFVPISIAGKQRMPSVDIAACRTLTHLRPPCLAER